MCWANSLMDFYWGNSSAWPPPSSGYRTSPAPQKQPPCALPVITSHQPLLGFCLYSFVCFWALYNHVCNLIRFSQYLFWFTHVVTCSVSSYFSWLYIIPLQEHSTFFSSLLWVNIWLVSSFSNISIFVDVSKCTCAKVPRSRIARF